MDEIAKIIAGVSPWAAIFLILGKQAIEVLHDYLKLSLWKQDRIIQRLQVIEGKLGIQPPDELDQPQRPVPKRANI